MNDRPSPWITITKSTHGGGPLVPALIVVVVLLAIWVGGFLTFTQALPRQAGHDAGTTEAIVVLTGGANRIKAGLALLAEQRAAQLLISGVDRSTTLEMLQSHSPVPLQQFACCVHLGHQARDTIGNALETRHWMRQEEFTSLRLVTASYHLPRSLLLFKTAMPEVKIVAHPVFSSHVDLDKWRLWSGTGRLLAWEYSKYLVSLLRVRLGVIGFS